MASWDCAAGITLQIARREGPGFADDGWPLPAPDNHGCKTAGRIALMLAPILTMGRQAFGARGIGRISGFWEMGNARSVFCAATRLTTRVIPRSSCLAASPNRRPYREEKLLKRLILLSLLASYGVAFWRRPAMARLFSSMPVAIPIRPRPPTGIMPGASFSGTRRPYAAWAAAPTVNPAYVPPRRNCRFLYASTGQNRGFPQGPIRYAYAIDSKTGNLTSLTRPRCGACPMKCWSLPAARR